MTAFQRPNLEDMAAVDKIRPKDCIRRFLAKKYNSISDLQKDNNKSDVYYDKEMDDTPYSILKKYEKQRKQMTADTFLEFLEENLIQKHDCNTNLAKELAKTLIEGKKQVSEGEYALLEIVSEYSEVKEPRDLTEMRVQYYVRKNSNWVRDDSISEEAFVDMQTLFCNMENKCYKNQTNAQCETTERASKSLKHTSNDRIISELDKRLSMTVEDMEAEIDAAIEKYRKSYYSTSIVRELARYKQNNDALNLIKKHDDEDKIVSPHIQTRDMILSLTDFVKQQQDIIWFVETYCRDAMVNELHEDDAWLYCMETNTKLLPHFMYVLANAFIKTNIDTYQLLLEKMCSNATLSDDGDYLIDTATGYPIKKRDFVAEDEYDDAGFKITSHSIIEKDLGTIIAETLAKKDRIFDNATDQMVYNVFSAISNVAGVPIENIEDFTLRVSLELIRNPTVIMEEDKYKQRAAKLEKDTGKTSVAYPIYKNQAIISIVAGVFLVSVQCVIPTIKTRKTFPGCVKSFTGYPLAGGVEDVSGLKYVACLINGIKHDEDPWKSIMKLNAALIATRIKDVLDKHIIKRTDVNDLYVAKREYLLLNPDEVIPSEHSIEKWRRFLPPVVEFSVISDLHNVASGFKSDLLETLKRGHSDQFSQLGVVQSKLHRYTFGIIEQIYNIVKSKTSLLKTSGGVPFLENACCNESSQTTHPLSYFEMTNPVIKQYVKITDELSRIQNEIRMVTKPGILYNEPFTGIVRPELPILETEKDIYHAVIHYAKFDRDIVLPENLRNITGEKPAGYKSTWSLEEKIEYLKRHGKQYDRHTLVQMMEQVRLNNIVAVSSSEKHLPVVQLTAFLETMELHNSEVIPAPLRELLLAAIHAYRPKEMKKEGTVKEIVQLRKYLAKTNENMLKEIINLNRGSFIKTYGGLDSRELKNLQDFMANIHVWEMDVPDAGYNGIYTVAQFIKNSVESLVKVYPSMIINDASYTTVHKHWGLSGFHSSDISKILKKYLEGLNAFKGDQTLTPFLQEIQQRTLDLHLLLQHIPMETPIEKGENTYFELFDKKTLYYLHVYCWYSVLYEYMNLANDDDLIHIDVQTKRRNRRDELSESFEPTNSISSAFSTSSDEVDEAQSELYDVEIRAGEKEDFQKRICSLMVAMLRINQQNKKTLDKPYSEIARKVRRSKEEEKKIITEYFKNMQKDERKVEDLLKQFHQGRWNVGIQKGIFQYDKQVYDNERNAGLSRLEQDLVGDEMPEFEQNDVEVADLEQDQNAENEEFYDREANDIGHFGDDYMDGNYYGDEGDNDFAYDD
jgi:hypothetical protein